MKTLLATRDLKTYQIIYRKKYFYTKKYGKTLKLIQ